MPIDALLFDKDGTLFDFSATWGAFGRSFLTRLADGDENLASYLGRQIGFDLKQCVYARDSIVIASTVAEIAQTLVPHVPAVSHAELVEMLNDESKLAPQIPAVPLAPLLSELRGMGKKLGVATNDAQEPAVEHLTEAGVRKYFDFIAGYDTEHGAKPGPGQMLAFAEHVGLAPASVAMVGDSRHDLEAGRAAGMTTIGVLTGIAKADDLSPLADVVLPDIGHIPSWLASA